ncbi:Trm112 family protein [Mycobacterium sp. 155]|uniref:Trm112 family protein n=1 Tax=Mycobacterium sp. 155 TaxID=1157943 RepID=UPI00037136FD|nr:Trm112 family protein [Mycobacterium sp. 155]
MIDEKLLKILVCPQDRGPLLLVTDERLREEHGLRERLREEHGLRERLREEHGSRDWLYNARLHRAYRIDDGIPVLLVGEAVEVDDADHQRLLELAGSPEAG